MAEPKYIEDPAYCCLRVNDIDGYEMAIINRSEVDFSGANLRSVDLRGADLEKVILKGAYLREALVHGPRVGYMIGANRPRPGAITDEVSEAQPVQVREVSISGVELG